MAPRNTNLAELNNSPDFTGFQISKMVRRGVRDFLCKPKIFRNRGRKATVNGVK